MPPYKLQRYSARLAWATPTNPCSLLLQQKRQMGASLLDLTTANPTEALAAYPHKEIAQAFAGIADFRYEPDALGSLAARQTVADWYTGQGIPAQAKRIALTASTSEAYAILFKLLCDPGDEILIPCPSYPLFDYLARAEAVKTATYHLTYDGSWFLDFDSLRKAISPRSKAIVVVNPNNPTGSFLKPAEATQLAALAAQHSLAIISDEVFMTYPVPGLTATPFQTFIGHDTALSFSLNGLSKAAGMPQMKLGWIAVNGPPQEAASALDTLELLLDGYLSVSTPVQRALPKLLQIGATIQQDICTRVQQNRQALCQLENSAIHSLASEGGWSTILQVPGIHSEEQWILKLLAEDNIVVQPGYFYDMAKEAYLVVSLLADPTHFSTSLQRLRGVVASG